MSYNRHMHRALKVKNDEFYTRMEDIEKAIPFYHPFLKGKRVLLPCDDYRYSQFYQYFKRGFHHIGIRSLKAVAYHKGSSGILCEYDGVTEKVALLENDGDFNHPDNLSNIGDSDVVITNPPYSLFQPFFATVNEYHKDFILLGNITALSQKGLFQGIQKGNCFIGNGSVSKFIGMNGEQITGACSLWYSSFATTGKSLSLSAHYIPEKYPELDNMRAISVDSVKEIPMDYWGIMAVPISYLRQHDPTLFDIISLGRFVKREMPDLYKHDACVDRTDVAYLNGKAKFQRILIRRKIPFE